MVTKEAGQTASAPTGFWAKLRGDWLRWLVLAVALVGAADAAYLTWVYFYSAATASAPVGCSTGCQGVLESAYSAVQLWPGVKVPNAILGLLMYLTVVAVVVLEGRLPGLSPFYAAIAVFGLGLTGMLYSVYLTYLQFFVIHYVCPYCIGSAISSTTIFILASLRLRRAFAA